MNDKIVHITPRYYVFASDEDGNSSDNPLLPSSDEDLKIRENTSSETSTSSLDQDLIDQVSLTNHLLVGIILFLGVFFGSFCMSHLYNRIRRD